MRTSTHVLRFGASATPFSSTRCASLTAYQRPFPCSLTTSSSTSAGALMCSRRGFYDRIREQRDGSDEGPDQMFSDFVKSPNRQRVPAELHRGNKDAVDGAERLNRIFFVFLMAFFAGLIAYIDPFNRDQYERPEGYGVTDPKVTFGSSDYANRRA